MEHINYDTVTEAVAGLRQRGEIELPRRDVHGPVNGGQLDHAGEHGFLGNAETVALIIQLESPDLRSGRHPV